MTNKCVGTPTWLQANLLALCAPLPMSLFIHLRGCINITKAFNHLACFDWEHRQWRLSFSSGLNAHHLATTNLFNGWHHSHHILLKHFISLFWSRLDCWLLPWITCASLMPLREVSSFVQIVTDAGTVMVCKVHCDRRLYLLFPPLYQHFHHCFSTRADNNVQHLNRGVVFP